MGVIIYYRRRMKVMKKDLKNRSVYYSDSVGSVDESRTHDLIVRDSDPLNVGLEAISTVNNLNNQASEDPNLLNNVRLTLDSQRYASNISEAQNDSTGGNSTLHV